MLQTAEALKEKYEKSLQFATTMNTGKVNNWFNIIISDY